MRLLLVVSLFVSFAFSAEAQMRRRPNAMGSYTHEIMTNLSGAMFQSGERCDGEGCDSGTELNFAGSYLHTWQNRIQVGGEGRFILASEEVSGTGANETRIEALGIGAYNFDSDFGNSFFVKGGIGLYSVFVNNVGRADEYENQLGFFGGVGKRFNWLGNVSYSPEVRLVKRGNLNLGIDIHLINLSIVW